MTAPFQAGDSVLERFRLERPLASGAMGQVWAARVVGSKDKVAVKLTAAEGVDRAERESDALSRLEHPGIVRYVDAGSIEQGHALVMELVDGVPLSKLLSSAPPGVPETLALAQQLAEALAHAHGRGVVHRDVKAANAVVVKKRGGDQLVLIDFGLGLVAGSPRLSSADVVLGSSHTMPPEQVQGLTAGPRADVYSLGSLLFRMVCGRYPFHASSPVQVLAMHAHAQVPTFAQRAKRAVDVPDGLEALVTRMLAKDPADRPDADEVVEQLAELAATPREEWHRVEATDAVEDPDGTPAPRPRQPVQAGARWAAPAALLVLGLALLLWYWLL